MRVAYIRVSTEEQHLDRQREALKQYRIERWYEEKISGKNMDRPKLKEMMDFIREGDIVYIHDFSRLARSTKDLLEILDRLKEKKVTLVSNKESFDTSTATGKLMLTMIAAINEFERQNILERQAEGIAQAKKKGVYKGRKKKAIKDIDKYYLAYMRREKSKPQIAKELGITRVTLDRRFKEYLDEQKAKGLIKTGTPMEGQESIKEEKE